MKFIASGLLALGLLAIQAPEANAVVCARGAPITPAAPALAARPSRTVATATAAPPSSGPAMAGTATEASAAGWSAAEANKRAKRSAGE